MRWNCEKEIKNLVGMIENEIFVLDRDRIRAFSSLSLEERIIDCLNDYYFYLYSLRKRRERNFFTRVFWRVRKLIRDAG